MDIKQLRTFIMTAETGSLGKTSDRLRIAQSALSRQLKLLEDEVGHPLFVRSARGMQLTEEGTELLARVAGPLDQIEKSLDDVRNMGSRPSGRVALGMIPSVSYVLAGRLAVRVARELPGVSLRIVEGYAGHIIDWLHRGDIDVGIVYGPASDLHLRVTELLFEELVLVGPTGWLPYKESVGISGLSEIELVLPSRPHGLRLVLEAAADKAGIALRVKYEADSFRVLKDLVEAGFGHTVLPRSAFSRERVEGRFQTTQLERPSITRQIVMALPSSRTDTRATAAVKALLINETEKLISSGEWQAVPGNGIRQLKS